MKTFKTKKIILVFILFVLLSVIISLMIGTYNISVLDVLKTLFGHGDKFQTFTIYELRLPRILLAVIVGSALGVSGTLLQTITKNPLAEPGMIGINSGAALFVVFWISLGTSFYYSMIPLHTTLLIPVIGAIRSIIVTVFIYFLSYKKGIKPVRFILTGVGVNSAISAIISFYQLSMSRGDYSQVLTWTNGSLWGSNWNYIFLAFPTVLVLILIVLYKSRVLDVLLLGDELSISVGVNIKKEIVILLVLSACLAAMATAFAGNIAFLGLIGPQIAKKVVGPIHKLIVPLSSCISTILLVISDIIARNLFAPIEIPVGIIVSILGVPYFIYLMLKRS